MSSALQAQQTLLRAQQTASTLLARTSAPTASTGSTGSGRAGSTTSTAPAAASGQSTSNQGTSNQGTSNQGGASSTSQAARITTDTAAVNAAQVALDTANRNLAAATLRSPIDGTVAAQPYTAESPESTSDAVTVVGSGAGQVTVNVSGTQRGQLAVGQQAKVTPDGAASAVTGVVTGIGLVPTSTSSGNAGSTTTTYPVTVLVAHPGSAFVDGGIASVSIVVKTVKGAISIPNSAVSNGTVTVLTAGKAVRTRITTGAVGALFTQVTSGLTKGQTVVLADLSQALPANSTTTTTRTGFAGGGPPGGFPGGGAARPGG
jgi:HlyD family secretion protein